MKEIWVSAFGYEGIYSVSNYGRVKSLNRKRSDGKGTLREKILKPYKEKKGYTRVCLYKDGKYKHKMIHELVLESFIGPCPDGMESRHYPDRTRSNCNLDNLSWATHSMNCADRIEHGTLAKGWRHGRSKISEEDRNLIFELFKHKGVKKGKLAKMFKISYSRVYMIIKERDIAA